MKQLTHKTALFSFMFGVVFGVGAWVGFRMLPHSVSDPGPRLGEFDGIVVMILFVGGLVAGAIWKRIWPPSVGLYCGLYAYWCYLCDLFLRALGGTQIVPMIFFLPVLVLIAFVPGCLAGFLVRRYMCWLDRPDGCRHFISWLFERNPAEPHQSKIS